MYKAGIVGCGRIGCQFDDDPKRRHISTHAGAYLKVPDTQLVALCDIDDEKLRRYGNKFRVPALYTSYEEMLKSEKLHILSICTWPDTHHVIAKRAATSGVRAIFCEKPLAVNLKSANEIIEACKENKVVLMVNHQRRFDPFYQSVKKYLQNGDLGRIQQAGFYYTAGIANTGSHMLDLQRFFFGDVDWVQGIYSANASPNPADPNIDGVLMFKNGLFCVIQACDVKSFLMFELDIVGTKGRFRLTHSGYDAEYYDIKESRLFSGYKELYMSAPPIDPNIPREPMVSAVQHLVGCLEHGREPICSGVDGKQALELIIALHESALRNGKKISLPLQKSNITVSSK